MNRDTSQVFAYRVADGWLRDLAAAPAPDRPWPCIEWDDALVADQLRFLDVQVELGLDHNVVWGLFVDRAWPVDLSRVVDDSRAARILNFVTAAHARGVKVLAGVGIYSWGSENIIRRVPGVAAAGQKQVMCPAKAAAWDWQRRVLDMLFEPRWGLDGISMQSADQGRCECPKCRRLPATEYHANLLVRAAEYVRAARPEWVIGHAAWGMRLDSPDDQAQVERISQAVNYIVEVHETPSARRKALVRGLASPFGSVGGVFVEPPQHWDRQRWFLPCGLGSAKALRKLWQDGGRACEYFYRPFANPGEEVSWRTGARILNAPHTSAERALREAVETVYGATGRVGDALAAWFTRAEAAYFSRTDFQVGQGPLSLEPLVSDHAGAAVYLQRMSPMARLEYARDLRTLKLELQAMDIRNRDVARRTLAGIDGMLRDLAGFK